MSLLAALAIGLTTITPQPVSKVQVSNLPPCQEEPTTFYQPPTDLIRSVLMDLDPSQPYQKQVTVLITVRQNGLVKDVTFSQSSGNRTIDISVQNWAYGYRFSPNSCSLDNPLKIALPVVLINEGGT
jgi:hypothetical protein